MKYTLAILFSAALLWTAAHAATDSPIPHGEVATPGGSAVVADDAAIADGGVVKAWYGCPTRRYRHAVLGDDIEGGCLVVEDAEGTRYTMELSDAFVFEDTTPRLADMNGDGDNEIVTIRSSTTLGAAIAIYQLQDGGLEEAASTPPIGLANRWLAPAGIADFNNDGRVDVAYVQTPHIGGTLRYWSMLDTGFVELANAHGFSNHAIGASRVSTSKLIDANNDGVIDLALPDQFRGETIIVTLHPTLSVLERRPYQVKFFDE